MKKKLLFQLLFLFYIFFVSCDNSLGIRILPLENAIQDELSKYKDIGGGKFRTPVHRKEYRESVKDVIAYSYYFEIDKVLKTVEMHLTLDSRTPLVNYRLGVLFDVGFSLEYFMSSYPYNFLLKDVFNTRVNNPKNDIPMIFGNLTDVTPFSLNHIIEINRIFQSKVFNEDLSGETNELFYFIENPSSSSFKNAFIPLHYYVFKTIERFLM